MNRAFAMLIIGLVFGGALGFVVAAANGVTLDGHDHATDHGPAVDQDEHAGHADHSAHHEPLVISEDEAPTLQIALFPDPEAGWNLNVQTTNFIFAPQNSGLAHVPGEGHAHVYANGIKLGRVYGDWMHLSLPDGDVTVTVSLNSNDHRPLAVGDQMIEASTAVNSGE